MLEKVGQGFCSDWFQRSNENPVKTSEVEIVNDLQYFCKKIVPYYIKGLHGHGF